MQSGKCYILSRLRPGAVPGPHKTDRYFFRIRMELLCQQIIEQAVIKFAVQRMAPSLSADVAETVLSEDMKGGDVERQGPGADGLQSQFIESIGQAIVHRPTA